MKMLPVKEGQEMLWPSQVSRPITTVQSHSSVSHQGKVRIIGSHLVRSSWMSKRRSRYANARYTMVPRGIEIASRSWNLIFMTSNHHISSSEFLGYILIGLYYIHVNYLVCVVWRIHCKIVAERTNHWFLSKTESVGPKMHQKTPKKFWSDHT